MEKLANTCETLLNEKILNNYFVHPKHIAIESTLKETHNRIKNMELEPVTFEGVWK